MISDADGIEYYSARQVLMQQGVAVTLKWPLSSELVFFERVYSGDTPPTLYRIDAQHVAPRRRLEPIQVLKLSRCRLSAMRWPRC